MNALKKEYRWDCYKVLETDNPIFVSFNSEIENEIKNLNYSQLLSLKIIIKNPSEDGLPSRMD